MNPVVVKINSSYHIQKYLDQMAKVIKAKNEMKATAAKDAGELRKQFTKRSTKVDGAGTENSHNKEEVSPDQVRVGIQESGAQSPKGDIKKKTTFAEGKNFEIKEEMFSEEYKNKVHHFNETNNGVSFK